MDDSTGIKVDKYLYWPHQLVGQGSFATVYRGKRLADHLPMAVKKIKINEMGNRINKLWSEIKIMKQLNHPNILKLYDVHLDLEDEVVYLFLEWCQDGDLSQLIKLLGQSQAIKTTQLTEKEIRDYFKQIRAGLEYLHQNSILHRDLKPQNILLNNGKVKICDFGLSILADQNSLITTMCGSPMYMAPEVICNQDYTTKADLWSLGVILYELFYGNHPYPVNNYHELMTAVKQPIKYPLDRVISDTGNSLLKGLLELDVETRLDWSDFFNHSWFQADLDNILRRRTGGRYQLEESDVFTMSIENEFYSCDDAETERSEVKANYETERSEVKANYETEHREVEVSADVVEANVSQELVDSETEHSEVEVSDESNIPSNFPVGSPGLHSGAIAIRNRNSQKKFDLSQYIVRDYNTPPRSASSRDSLDTSGSIRDLTGQSAPVRHSGFGESYSPRMSFHSVGSQVYKCLSKSYGVLKKNL